MNKENSTVPTAIAFIGFIAVVVFFIVVIKSNVEQNSETAREEEQSEVGKLEDITVSIKGQAYFAKSESTKAVQSFIAHLPLEVDLKDQDGNRKVGITYFKLDSNPQKIKKAYAGDLLLEGNSTIILVYDSFKTSEKYTKIGHIENLPDLGNGNVRIRLSLDGQ